MASTLAVDKIKTLSGVAIGWPAADGALNQVLGTDGAGTLSFRADAAGEVSKGADIASADPLVITTGANYFICTGTTGFNDMTVGANRHFYLEFSGILTMTHVAGVLDLPSGLPIATVAGDVGEFYSTAANVVTCVNYTRATGKAVAESVALDVLGFTLVRDVEPGESVFIDVDGNLFSKQCAEKSKLTPCIFEYVYLARPDSLIDGVSVYQTRLDMGATLAEKIKREWGDEDIDVVIPIPDTSRPSALQVGLALGLEYREGFIKNRYIGRTFIMPGQELRKKSVRQKLNPIGVEFAGKNVLLIDDSIVRGTTSRQIVQMARDAGANKVYFASAAPPVRFPNVYGIDMPSRDELLATGRTDAEICKEIGADGLIYQDLEALEAVVLALNPSIQGFDSSCFDGNYVTGDVDGAYLDHIEALRADSIRMDRPPNSITQMDLNLVDTEEEQVGVLA
jgi:adenine/guanine phosphoribosyltransferase-like PRPP-binding protein